MSFFNSNITGGNTSGGVVGGLVTKFEKKININSSELAEVVINLSEDISNYNNITNEQIIVELNGVAANLSGGSSGKCTIEHNYDAETGDLTITSSSSRMPFSYNSADMIEIAIYVAGAVQLPPAPEYAVPTLGAMVGYAESGPNTSNGTVSIALTKQGLTVDDIVVLYADVTFGQGAVYNGSESQNFSVRQTSLSIENNVLNISTGGFSSSNKSGSSWYSNKSYIGATKVFVFEKG